MVQRHETFVRWILWAVGVHVDACGLICRRIIRRMWRHLVTSTHAYTAHAHTHIHVFGVRRIRLRTWNGTWRRSLMCCLSLLVSNPLNRQFPAKGSSPNHSPSKLNGLP